MAKAKSIEKITIIRATVAGGKRVESDSLLTVGEHVSESDARLLINMRKAVSGEVKPRDRKPAKAEE